MFGPGASLREPIEGRLRARPLSDTTAVLTVGVHELPIPGESRALLAVPEARDGAPAPLMVMLHGAGADARQSIDLVGDEAGRRGVVIMAPESQSSTWDLLVQSLGPDVEAIDDALAQVFPRCAVDPGRVAIGGFSDGASYALSLGMANGDLFSWVLAFSPGFMAPPILVGRPAVFVSHGKDDRILPIGPTSRRIVRELEAAGYPVAYQEFSGGHMVPREIVASALDALLGT